VTDQPTGDGVVAPDLSYVSRDLDGVGGWLLLFVIGQVGVVLVQLIKLPAAWEPFTNGTMQLAGRFTLLGPLLVVEFLFHIAQIILPAVGLWLIFRRNTSTRRFWVAYLFILCTYAVLDIVGTHILFSQMREAFGADALVDANAQMKSARLTNLRLALVAVIWAAYWTRSERVRVTFHREASAV
jgi:hypothetical protein